MIETVEFYFDFVSPFSYLAHVKLPGIVAKHGYAINYCPVDVSAAKLAAGNYGPSNLEIPSKLKMLTADIRRWAVRYGVPLTFPKKMMCERWNVGAIYASEKGMATKYVTEAYHRIWGLGIDPTEDPELRKAAESLGWDPEDFLTYVSSSRMRTEFRRRCVEAHRIGIFGVPIVQVEDQMWWGNDRLTFFEEFIAAKARLAPADPV